MPHGLSWRQALLLCSSHGRAALVPADDADEHTTSTISASFPLHERGLHGDDDHYQVAATTATAGSLHERVKPHGGDKKPHGDDTNAGDDATAGARGSASGGARIGASGACGSGGGGGGVCADGGGSDEWLSWRPAVHASLGWGGSWLAACVDGMLVAGHSRLQPGGPPGGELRAPSGAGGGSGGAPGGSGGGGSGSGVGDAPSGSGGSGGGSGGGGNFLEAPGRTLGLGGECTTSLGGGAVSRGGSGGGGDGSGRTLGLAGECMTSLGGERAVCVAAGEAGGLALDGSGRVWQLHGNFRAAHTHGSTPPRVCLDSPAGRSVEEEEGAEAGAEAAASSAVVLRMSVGPGHPAVRICAVACGARHSIAVTTCGLVFGWGWNGVGAAGLGIAVHECAHPELLGCIAGAVRMAGVAAGLQHTLLLSDIGDVYSCGWNSDGQLGHGGSSCCMEPVLVEGLTEEVAKVSCGARHSLALGSCGHALWAWGWGAWGQLGTGDTTSRDMPTCVALPGLGPDQSSSAAWQGGGGGGEPDGDTAMRDDTPSPRARVVDVEGGRWHTVVLIEGGG
ncbi:hypothetical protein FOA52_011168 [Chlamydomonas sp. UWO 241]|nr:hypothetical protein FOA52_011168 [Chlamydomonas sp. UWO 241]